MNKIPAAVLKASKASKEFIFASEDEIERLLQMLPDRPHPVCPSDPCPYCTAAENLQIAMIDLENLYEELS